MKYIVLLFAIILSSCAPNLPQNPFPWMESWGQNDCLPTAICFKQALGTACAWSHVICYTYKDAANKGQLTGHAIVAYMYPTGQNQLWTYDYMGSYRVRAYLTDPIVIAQLAEIERGRPMNTVTQAEFVDK